MLHVIERPDVYKMESLGDPQVMTEFSEDLRVGFEGNEVFFILGFVHGYESGVGGCSGVSNRWSSASYVTTTWR